MNTVVLDVWGSPNYNFATWDNTVHTILSSRDTKLVLWAAQEWALAWHLEKLPAVELNTQLEQLRQHMQAHNVEIVYVFGHVNGNHHQPHITNKGIISPIPLPDDSWLPCTTYHWPAYWMQHSIGNYVYNCDRTLPYNYSEFNQLFVCMQSRPHVHRMYLQDQLHHSGLLDKNHCSWNVPTWDYYTKPADVLYKFEHWQERQMIIDDKFQDQPHGAGLCTSILSRSDPVNYQGCFMDLISESTTEVAFITEKSVRPLLSLKPFLIVGGVGIHAALADLGFELYDEIFDYSFDTITDSAERIDAIISQLTQLQLRYDQGNLQLYPAYMQLLPKLHRNFVRFHEILKTNQGMPDFVQDNPQLFPNMAHHQFLRDYFLGLDWVQQFIKSYNS